MPLMIGTLAGGVAGMTAVENLVSTNRGIKTFSVEIVPVHNSRYMKLGNGALLGQGWRQCEWHLNGIRDAHWAALKAYATNQSTQVYIQTLKEDGKTFGNYLALMTWPENPPNRDHTTNVVLDFTIVFTQLILQ